jgi:GNAT superfamily N-acetyltransferase
VNRPELINFAIEPLEKRHERAAFRCGNQELDLYFQRQVNQDKKRNLAVPYVALDLKKSAIIGYYTLSMSGINLEILPQATAKKLPRYPIVGVTLIGRLAVAQNYQGYGWGKMLLMDALYKSLEVSFKTASFAVVVDAIDEQAVEFYQRFDFQPFPDQPRKLFRTMKNIAQTFA